MSYCKTDGQCDKTQKLWCDTHECKNDIIQPKKNDINEYCSTSSDCISNNCVKPSCDGLSFSSKCDGLGVCALSTDRT